MPSGASCTSKGHHPPGHQAFECACGEQDGKPLPKVIDFGIAKAIDQRVMERATFTEMGSLVGTPEYMSPEQTLLSSNIDTTTDVYSLGVRLYELLRFRSKESAC